MPPKEKATTTAAPATTAPATTEAKPKETKLQRLERQLKEAKEAAQLKAKGQHQAAVEEQTKAKTALDKAQKRYDRATATVAALAKEAGEEPTAEAETTPVKHEA